jgi:hypothetical protein
MTDPGEPELKKSFPSRRAAVFIPTAIFVPIDILLLSSSGRSWLSVLLYALITAPLIGWWLNRNYDRRFAAYKRKHPELFNEDPTALAPPSGSWANPNRRQKLLDRFTKINPYRRR